MTPSTWAALAGILVVDVLNPVLLGVVVYALGTARPYAVSGAILAGHTLAYFVAGILLALGIDAMLDRLQNPREIDFWIEAVLGLGLVASAAVAWRTRDRPARPAMAARQGVGAGAAFVTGAVINVVGIPFALPYFAALDQILKAELTTAGALAVLLAYNLGYAAPFAALVLLRWAFRRESRLLLAKLSGGVERLAAVVFPLLLGGLALALLADAAHYFARGRALF